MTTSARLANPTTSGSGDAPVIGSTAEKPDAPDRDTAETTEWLEALDAVIAHDGPERA